MYQDNRIADYESGLTKFASEEPHVQNFF